MLRQCRICGDEPLFPSVVELDKHITEAHQLEQFGNLVDVQSEGEETDVTDNLLGSLREDLIKTIVAKT